MSLSDLQTELGLNFPSTDQANYWKELTHVANNVEEHLGPEAAAASDNELAALAAELGKERVAFGPNLETIALNGELFAQLGYQAPPYLADLMKSFRFYLLNIPITLLPRPGGGFSRLDCIVEFNAGAEANQRPIAYQMFPQEVWQDVIHAWQGVSVGLNENLEFKVNPTGLVEELTSLSAPVKAEVELKAGANAGFVAGPFDYRIRTPKITSRGRGDAKVYWRLSGEDIVTEQDPRLAVVLKVPAAVQRVDVNAVLAARRTFHFFTSHLSDLFDYISDSARAFFEAGAPTSDQTSWKNVTA